MVWRILALHEAEHRDLQHEPDQRRTANAAATARNQFSVTRRRPSRRSAPSRNSEPCARLTLRIRPKTSVKPLGHQEVERRERHAVQQGRNELPGVAALAQTTNTTSGTPITPGQNHVQNPSGDGHAAGSAPARAGRAQSGSLWKVPSFMTAEQLAAVEQDARGWPADRRRPAAGRPGSLPDLARSSSPCIMISSPSWVADTIASIGVSRAYLTQVLAGRGRSRHAA